MRLSSGLAAVLLVMFLSGCAELDGKPGPTHPDDPDNFWFYEENEFASIGALGILAFILLRPLRKVTA